MRRADRLFEIVHHLRGRRLTTAAQLAQWLEVSERTIYRDIADLSASGVPIDGEAGVGYRLRPQFELPPLMFSHNEIEALVMGARMVQAWGGPTLASGARSALAKISAALPRERIGSLDGSRLFAPDLFITPAQGERFEQLRRATNDRCVAVLHYIDAQERTSERRVRPLGLFFWSGVWIIGTWCELRNGFRNFRLDRITSVHVSDERFVDEPGRTLEDFLRAMKAE